MRSFCLIFSLYLFSLSCLPCNDGDHEHIGQSSETGSYFTPSGSSSQHTHCADACSPFCGCQCCSVTCAFRVASAFECKQFVMVEQTGFSPVRPIWLKDVSIAIDHPPQFI